jgi:hypothetical protein
MQRKRAAQAKKRRSKCPSMQAQAMQAQAMLLLAMLLCDGVVIVIE